MRQDMHKVVVERPRAYAYYRYRDMRFARKRIVDADEPDEIPRHEGMRRPYLEEPKALNENLSPLRRFLESRVGKPWDKVYSEISKQLRASNPVQQHVRDHLEDFVCLRVLVQDGRYVSQGRRGFFSSYNQLSKGDLFVNEAGILCRLRHDRPKTKSRCETYVVSSLTEYTEARRNVKKTKTTYFLHRKRDYSPLPGETSVETFEAVSYESAQTFFRAHYGAPVLAEQRVGR